MKIITLIICTLLSAIAFGQGTKKIWLPSILSDNMLVQQNTQTNIWGKTLPGKTIDIAGSWGITTKTTADPSGKWKIGIATPKAGGPYTITIKGNDTSIVIKNILAGEVWFCSGQSNMEMPLAGWPPTDTIMHSQEELSKPANDKIRLFNVKKAYSENPLDDCVGHWEICNSNSLATFSATAYFFGKKLSETIKQPIGLIESAWGGTPIEAWMSTETLLKQGDFKEALENIEKSKPLLADYMIWIKSHPVVNLNPGDDKVMWKHLPFNDQSCRAVSFDDSKWHDMTLPTRWEELPEMGEFDGVVWFRKSIDIPEAMLGKDLQLSLGPIDDMDETYFNGEVVGNNEVPGGWQVPRIYSIPAKLVKPGRNTLSIRVIDTQGGGGIGGLKHQMFLSLANDTSLKVELAGNWRYLPTAMLIDNKFYLYGVASQEFFFRKRIRTFNQNAPTTLFNGMVNPVINYSIKGAIWYQGESNVGRANQYAQLLPLLMKNWRDAWGISNLPFYYAQIAPYAYGDENASQSAELREAQFKSIRTPYSGMAVLLDLGMVKNIHPPYKKEVGERLAYWALAKDYNVRTDYSGPVFQDYRVKGNELILTFKDAEGLNSGNRPLDEFEIAGADGKYFKATAKIKNNEVVLSASAVLTPVAARYGWRNGAQACLFNKAGLPATSFRTEGN